MACVICGQAIDFDRPSEFVKLTEKGCVGINKANHDRQLDLPDIVFSEDADVFAHKICRSRHTNPKTVKTAQKRLSSLSPVPTPNLRSAERLSVFDYKTHCLFCGAFVDQSVAEKRPDKTNCKFSHVMTLGFQENIYSNCHDRKDDWALKVESRLSAVNDLPAEEALYHHTCYALFTAGKNLPSFSSDQGTENSRKRRKVGRPRSTSKADALQYVFQYLEENDDETVTIQELHQHMIESSGLGQDDVYTQVQLKRELESHYGSRVTITTVKSFPNVVTLTSNIKSIIQEAHSRARDLKEQSDMDKLIEIVGKYIRTEIKSMKHHNNMYPTTTEMSSLNGNFTYLPQSLQILLGSIIKSKNARLHSASIGQSIMQSTCPRSFLPPLQVGLSVTLEHKYGHRDLVDMISKLGFCSSYSEANKYRANAAAFQGVDLPEDVTSSFLQYQADNVDHACRTLDGHGSVHVMGQMATFTPAIQCTRQIPRLKVDMEVVKRLAKVNIVAQNDPKSVQSEIKYQQVELFEQNILNNNLDIMWTVSFHLSQSPPMWSGYMQMLHNKLPHQGKSSDIFLPLIDLTPSDPTCVRSTLEYIVDHASRYNTTPVITFDQQLWWIAYLVIEAQPRASLLHQIVLILGGFHTEMSFLGSIGTLMAGSGLKEVMSQVYAEGSVDHMLSGKAVARAVRAHLLTDSALNIIATAEMLGVSIPRVFDEDSCSDGLQRGDFSFSVFHVHDIVP